MTSEQAGKPRGTTRRSRSGPTFRGSCFAISRKTPSATCWTAEGSVVFVDISGLHEALREARQGRQGGRRAGHRGDRGLLHRPAGRRLRERRQPDQVRRRRAPALVRGRATTSPTRAAPPCGCAGRCATSAGSRCPGSHVQLRMSVGVHTGTFHFFLVGGSHRELVVAGPGWTGTARDGARRPTPGTSCMSPEVAARLAGPRASATPRARGSCSKREPPGHHVAARDPHL